MPQYFFSFTDEFHTVDKNGWMQSVIGTLLKHPLASVIKQWL